MRCSAILGHLFQIGILLLFALSVLLQNPRVNTPQRPAPALAAPVFRRAFLTCKRSQIHEPACMHNTFALALAVDAQANAFPPASVSFAIRQRILAHNQPAVLLSFESQCLCRFADLPLHTSAVWSLGNPRRLPRLKQPVTRPADVEVITANRLRSPAEQLGFLVPQFIAGQIAEQDRFGWIFVFPQVCVIPEFAPNGNVPVLLDFEIRFGRLHRDWIVWPLKETHLSDPIAAEQIARLVQIGAV